jgi:ABC-type nickel/cobalt efflux system permease component RcnA
MPKHRVQLSFSKDASACRQAPPSPCPLTLFAMFLALARGVPEAGLTFALSMMTGVELTLAAVAALVIVGRDWFVGIVAVWHGSSRASPAGCSS